MRRATLGQPRRNKKEEKEKRGKKKKKVSWFIYLNSS
jgi:hypothetical protein